MKWFDIKLYLDFKIFNKQIYIGKFAKLITRIALLTMLALKKRCFSHRTRSECCFNFIYYEVRKGSLKYYVIVLFHYNIIIVNF